jgi:S-adenosylmethionine hydrolase
VNNPIITLSTDFGYSDPFSGIMKGVILTINPLVTLVDITHGIRQYDVRDAAFSIGMSYRYFKTETIHIVVADPGVGSERRPILVVNEHSYFVGPDNGVFSLIYQKSEHCDVYHITSTHYFMHDMSSSFHARDIFAPVAAWLSKGITPSKFGEPITDYMSISFPVLTMPTPSTLEGEVIYIDHFGNTITNIRGADVERLRMVNPEGTIRIVRNGTEVPLKEYYSQADDDGLYAILNSMDYLELFVYKGNASDEYNIEIGDTLGLMLLP